MNNVDPARLVVFKLMAGSLYSAFVLTMDALVIYKARPEQPPCYFSDVVSTFVTMMKNKGCEMDTNELSHLIIDAILLYTQGER
jgi:hypothetical protein